MSRDHSLGRRAWIAVVAASWLTAAGTLSAQPAEDPPRDPAPEEGGLGLLTQPVQPSGLSLDLISIVGASDGNGVFEPGERVLAAPLWKNMSEEDIVLTGTALGLEGPAGANYSVMDGSASYGVIAPGDTASCLGMPTGDCYELHVTSPVSRPAMHWDAAFTEAVSAGVTHAWTVHLGDSFFDVPRSHSRYAHIETLLHLGVTGGCGPGLYCPNNPVTREQIAVFIVAAKYGPTYAPPACQAGSERFSDVPASSPYCPWIEELDRQAVVPPCSAGGFCPTNPVKRSETAQLVVSAVQDEPTYAPPECMPGLEQFEDVPASDPQCAWIEALASMTAGGPLPVDPACSPDIYCPTEETLRGEVSGFLVAGFKLSLYRQ